MVRRLPESSAPGPEPRGRRLSGPGCGPGGRGFESRRSPSKGPAKRAHSHLGLDASGLTEQRRGNSPRRARGCECDGPQRLVCTQARAEGRELVVAVRGQRLARSSPNPCPVLARRSRCSSITDSLRGFTIGWLGSRDGPLRRAPSSRLTFGGGPSLLHTREATHSQRCAATGRLRRASVPLHLASA